MTFQFSLKLVFLTVVSINCFAQKNKLMKSENNPLLCDPKTGICELPIQASFDSILKIKQPIEKPIKIIYFTDPICSACWGIEPQLRKLILNYGKFIEIDYRMGGLLPDWNYNSGGINKPSDVAHHWDEVSAYYDMPIDGDLWLKDPLPSSYPPSIAYKAAQIQDIKKAKKFLRIIREMVFLKQINIAKMEHLTAAAEQADLDVAQFKLAMEGAAKKDFEADLKLTQTKGIRGFPTLFFSNQTGKTELIYGYRDFDYFEKTLLKLFPEAQKNDYPKDWQSLFKSFESLTSKEFSVLSEMPRNEVDKFLNQLVAENKLTVLKTKNGNLWRLK